MDSVENVQTIPGIACLFDPVKLSQREQRMEEREEGGLCRCTIKLSRFRSLSVDYHENRTE